MILLADGRPFSQGWSRSSDHVDGGPDPDAKVYVRIGFPGQDDLHLALLDTGSTWSVLPGWLARRVPLGAPTLEGRLLSAFGTLAGRVYRIPTILAADPGCGQSLHLEAPWLVVDEGGPQVPVLGWGGFLEHLRTALDGPASTFYFGPA